ncbi:hypothetical protein BJ741DRAFT_522085, partial [Chytriomyces cf. hyalinus JEL632]
RGSTATSTNKSTVRCQKCLIHGHYSYECSGQRLFATRPSRTQLLNKQMNDRLKGIQADVENESVREKKGLADSILEAKEKGRKAKTKNAARKKADRWV